MQKLPTFVDMQKTPKELKEDAAPISMGPQNLYPYGLCICLTQEELDKLDLDQDVDTGDMIHLQAIGKVTSVSKYSTDEGQDCRVEIQLTSIALEEDSHDDEGDDDASAYSFKGRNPYTK